MNLNFLASILMILVGSLYLNLAVTSLAKKKMAKTVSLMWITVMSVFILGGIFLRPQVNRYISPIGGALLVVAVLCVLSTAFFMSLQVSILMRKCEELAQQVSLLNGENEYFRKTIEEYVENREENIE